MNKLVTIIVPVLAYLANWIFHSFFGVNWLCAFITILFTFLGLYKLKDYIHYGLTIWTIGFSYYIFMYGLNRIMIAVAIVTWAYHYLLDQKIKSFLFWVVVAGMFHYSAFIMIPVCIIAIIIDKNNVSFPWEKILVLMVVLIALLYFVAPRILPMNSWAIKYKQYFQLQLVASSALNNASFFLLFIIIICSGKKMINITGKASFLVWYTDILFIFTILFTIFHIHRLSYYLFPCACMLYSRMPEVFIKSNDNKSAVLIYLCMFAMGIFFIYYNTTINELWAPVITPYRMFEFS